MQNATSSSVVRRSTPAILRIFAIIALILLAVQFMDGEVINLFVQVPPVHPGVQPANYFMGVVQTVEWAVIYAPPGLQIHVIAGLLLFIAAVILHICAIVLRQGSWIAIAIIGLIGIIGAGFNGASFMNYGGLNLSSLLMSIGFLLAAIVYTIGIAFAH
ncbi:MAG: hypothetical protein ABI406_11465 [Ktedonobacteraceae bacterium]